MLSTNFSSAFAEAQLLHGRDDTCAKRTSDALFFSIFRKIPDTKKPSQRSFRMSLLETVVNATAGNVDTYISQSSFFKCNRQIINFKQTRAAWVDLDLYNIGRTGDSAMIAEILAHSESLGIPLPTAIISSGRGLYLKWVFETPVTQMQLPVWQQLQATLTTAYKSLAADFKSRDAARVFRLIDTCNSKSGGIVKALEGAGRMYDFGMLCKAVESLRVDLLIEETREKVISSVKKTQKTRDQSLLESAERGNAEALVLYSELHQPILINGMDDRMLNWARFCDLRDLYIARGGIPVGDRDNVMFWMLNCLGHARVIHSSRWNEEIKELLSAFPDLSTFSPLSDGSMQTLLRRLKDKETGKKYTWKNVEHDPLYRPGNEFLIDTFGIKLEEMIGLRTIISGVEKRARMDQKNDGRAESRNERLRWRLEAEKVFVELAAQDAVAQAISEPTPAIDAVAVMPAPEPVSAVNRVNFTHLAQKIGTERTRLVRYWNHLKDGTSKSLLKTALAQPHKRAKKGEPKVQKGAYVPNSKDIRAATVAIEALIAHSLALKTKVEMERLALRRQMDEASEKWARSKVDALIQFVPPEEFFYLQSDEIDHNSVNEENQNKQGETMSDFNNLERKIHLLNVANAVISGVPAPRVAPVPVSVSVVENKEIVSSNVVSNIGSAPAFSPELEYEMAGNGGWMDQAHDFDDGSVAIALPPLASSAPVNFDQRPKAPVSPVAPAPINPRPQFSAPALRPVAMPGQGIGVAVPRFSPPRLAPIVSSGLTIDQQMAAQAIKTQTPRRPVSPTPASTPVRPAPVFLVPAPAPKAVPNNSTDDVMRRINERVKSLPPLMREPVKSNTKALVPGGPLAPTNYPSPQEWASDTIPPGSRYSEKEWDEGRIDADGNACYVFEMQTEATSWLMQLIKPKIETIKTFVDGVVKTERKITYPESVKSPEFPAVMTEFYSDCIFVSEKSFPKFVGAVESSCVLGGTTYRVIRPRTDYTDPSKAIRISAKLDITLDDSQNESESLPVERGPAG